MSLERLANAQARGTACDEDIVHLNWLLIDFDPKRQPNTAATDGEKAEAEGSMQEVRSVLGELGWPDPVVADSGNGFHLLYRIDLPNDEQSRALVKFALVAIANRFSTAAVEIDRSVYNPSRITRLYGTTNRKGENSVERPWRRSSLLSVPAQPVPVSIGQLQMLQTEFDHIGAAWEARAWSGMGEGEGQHAGEAPVLPGAHEGEVTLSVKRFDMERFLTTAGIQARGPLKCDQGLKWILD
jgi:hypothetical protein